MQEGISQPLATSLQGDQYDRGRTQYVQSKAVSQAIMGHNRSIGHGQNF